MAGVVQQICTRATVQRVIASTTIQSVVAGHATQHVVGGISGDVVSTRATVDVFESADHIGAVIRDRSKCQVGRDTGAVFRIFKRI